MNRIGRAAVMLALGGITARLLLNGGFGWFVQQRMRLPLWGATIVLLVFGAYELWKGSGDERRDPESTRWAVGPRVGWMMVLPLVVLISVAPTGLGAAAAGRVDAYTPDDTTDAFEPLDTGNGPVEMRVFDFLDRALWDENRSLEDVPVRLEGLVVNDDSVDDGFKLTRFMVSCCAADGIPLQVTLHGTGAPLADDEWVVVDVVWRAPDVPYQDAEGDWAVEADVVSLTVSDTPKDPYESPY